MRPTKRTRQLRCLFAGKPAPTVALLYLNGTVGAGLLANHM